MVNGGRQEPVGAPLPSSDSLQGPWGPTIWAAAAGDSSGGWTGSGKGQVKDSKRHIYLGRFRGHGKEIEVLLSLLPVPRPPVLSQC